MPKRKPKTLMETFNPDDNSQKVEVTLLDGHILTVTHYPGAITKVSFRLANGSVTNLRLDSRELMDIQNAISRPMGKDWKNIGGVRDSGLRRVR